MPICRPFPSILSIILITIVVSFSTTKTNDDASGILIGKDLSYNRYRCVTNLLGEMIADKQGLFQNPSYQDFFAASNIRLVFSEKRLSGIGGESTNAFIDSTNGNFLDTIYLNRDLFKMASREYFAAVIIHESLHAYTTWANMSCFYKLNKVDTPYLKRHFSASPHWEWLTARPFVDEKKEHTLMSEVFSRRWSISQNYT